MPPIISDLADSSRDFHQATPRHVLLKIGSRLSWLDPRHSHTYPRTPRTLPGGCVQASQKEKKGKDAAPTLSTLDSTHPTPGGFRTCRPKESLLAPGRCEHAGGRAPRPFRLPRSHFATQTEQRRGPPGWPGSAHSLFVLASEEAARVSRGNNLAGRLEINLNPCFPAEGYLQPPRRRLFPIPIETPADDPAASEATELLPPPPSSCSRPPRLSVNFLPPASQRSTRARRWEGAGRRTTVPEHSEGARALGGGAEEEQLTLAGGVRPPSDASERPASDWSERKTTRKVRGKRLEVRGWEDTAERANSDL